MSKHFYVVVNYGGTISNSGVSSLATLFQKKASGPLLDQDQFNRYRAELANRVNLIGTGLSRLGVQVKALNTQQLIELFYAIYNPDIASEERLVNIQDLSADVVSSLDHMADSLDNEPPPSQPATDNPPSQPTQ